MPLSAAPAARRRAAGFTLVEMLVSLVITSVGLLGIAKMSIGTVQANNSAFMRSQATALVQQIIDNMRANRTAATSGDYIIAVGASAGGTGIASYDLSTWKALLAKELPSGDGSVSTAAVNNPLTGQAETVATVQVQWDDSVAEQTPDASPTTVTVETML
jgi:type IV pilus assembly protein PilV